MKLLMKQHQRQHCPLSQSSHVPAGISIRYTACKAPGQETRIMVYCPNKILGCVFQETGVCILEVEEASPRPCQG